MIRKSKYKSLAEFKKGDPKAYRAIYEAGKVDDICKIFGWIYNKRIELNENSIAKIALTFKTRKVFGIKNNSAYKAAIKLGILDKVCKHMKSLRNNWSKLTLTKAALNCKSIREFQKKYSGGYEAAVRMGLLDEISRHMKKRGDISKYWTKERCIKEASKYKSRRQWQLNNNSSYFVASKNKWLEYCTRHMKKRVYN